jgi:hypothetical protein
VEQSNSTNSIVKSTLSTGVVDIAQNSTYATAVVKQVGYALARISQAQGVSPKTRVTQLESADASNDGGLEVIISQSGENELDIEQVGGNLSASVWQMLRTSGNQVTIAQGKVSLTTNSSADVVQGGLNNWASLNQDGTGLDAQIRQSGQGGVEAMLRNSISIIQGGANNHVEVAQAGGVGPSNSSDPQHLGLQEMHNGGMGPRQSRVDIFQTGLNNSLTVEQHGRGQHARVEQGGDNNIAAVVQTSTAVNSTVYLIQSGTGNSYTVTQERAGEYVRVSQTGNSNSVVPTVVRTP